MVAVVRVLVAYMLSSQHKMALWDMMGCMPSSSEPRDTFWAWGPPCGAGAACLLWAGYDGCDVPCWGQITRGRQQGSTHGHHHMSPAAEALWLNFRQC